MSEPDVSGLLSVQQAIRVIDAVPVYPRTARLPLAKAAGLRLGLPLSTDADFPPFDKSLMDGVAVRRADVRTTPIELKVIGEVAAGKSFDRSLGEGEAVAIMTGAPMPAGADGVVPVEDVERLSPEVVRILRAADNPARFIAARGSDCPAGRVVVPAGTPLGPTQVAAAASVGAAEVEVFLAPRVAVLATGDELVPAAAMPGPAQIRNSNSPMLVALLQRMGCEVTDLGGVPDDPDAIRAALHRGLEFEALFVTGGMSMGEYDYVPRLLAELGVDLKITRLRIKPGKPFVFGIREAAEATRAFVFGLPGNPVSAYVCTLRIASRLLARMAGGTPQERWLTGRLDTGMPPNGPREFYQPAIRTMGPGRDSTHGEFAAITPLAWRGSADLFTLARANVLLVRPENDPPLPRGTVVRVLDI